MSLKLNSSGGGSVLLQEPSTASNRTLTLPDADGTVIYSDASANLQFNSGYGSVATAYGCRAWVNFNGTGTVAIRASGNVSSITDNGTGDYTLNFTTSMPDANYSASGVVGVSPGATAGFTGVFDSSAAPTTSALRVYSVSAANALTDYTRVFYAVFR
jgi:hypothetical protein